MFSQLRRQGNVLVVHTFVWTERNDMKKIHFSSENRKVVGELAEKFLNGDKLSIREIVENYGLPTKEQWQKVMSRRKVSQWLKSVRAKLYKEEDVWLTGIDTVGDNQERVFGIVSTSGQAEYAMTQYYTLTKGVVKNANRLALNVKSQGLLKGRVGTEELLLPKVKGKE